METQSLSLKIKELSKKIKSPNSYEKQPGEIIPDIKQCLTEYSQSKMRARLPLNFPTNIQEVLIIPSELKNMISDKQTRRLIKVLLRMNKFLTWNMNTIINMKDFTTFEWLLFHFMKEVLTEFDHKGRQALLEAMQWDDIVLRMPNYIYLFIEVGYPKIWKQAMKFLAGADKVDALFMYSIQKQFRSHEYCPSRAADKQFANIIGKSFLSGDKAFTLETFPIPLLNILKRTHEVTILEVDGHPLNNIFTIMNEGPAFNTSHQNNIYIFSLLTHWLQNMRSDHQDIPPNVVDHIVSYCLRIINQNELLVTSFYRGTLQNKHFHMGLEFAEVNDNGVKISTSQEFLVRLVFAMR